MGHAWYSSVSEKELAESGSADRRAPELFLVDTPGSSSPPEFFLVDTPEFVFKAHRVFI